MRIRECMACHNHNDKKQPARMNALQPLRVDTTAAIDTAPALSECVTRALRRYLQHADGALATDLYHLVLAEVEAPMLREVLRHADGNLTRASEILGITRATLRKKLAEHRLG
jgi:Fis family transcriptional regulator